MTEPVVAGWYTAAQAAAGAQGFGQSCAVCHGGDLRGGAGPALVGDTFLDKWGTRTIGDLSAFEHGQMPLSSPGSLSPQQYADSTAFILAKNGFTAGSAPLMATGEAGRVMRLSRAAQDLQRRVTANAPGQPAVTRLPTRAAPVVVKQPSTLGPTQSELLAADAATGYWPFFNKGLMGFRYFHLGGHQPGNRQGSQGRLRLPGG
ncbi:MAG: c-type cytochrome [Geminicoccaceae bacterium]